MNKLHLAGAGLLSLSLLAAGCGGSGGGIGGTGNEVGTLHVALTDAPACGYDAVNVTVEKVRVHRSATAGDDDAGWSEIVLSPARRIDLLSLQNGVLEDLGQTQLPAGAYTQLRLVLAANDGAHPLANSVVPTGGVETALDTPSGQQSGLKLNADLQVPANKVLDLVLDFDACKSVVRAGNSGKYNLKPVLSVTTVLSDAGQRVVGYVDAATAAAGASVSLQSGAAIVKAGAPDASGRFVLYPVPAGSYDLVVSASGHVTAVVTGVPVTTTAYTDVGGVAAPIAPPLSTPADAAVGGTVQPATAAVRALQALTGGPTVEVRWAVSDASTGTFALSLPVGAPVKAAYVPSPQLPVFAADAAVAGKYTVEATSSGVAKTAQVDATAPVPPLSFVFP